jgi:D-tagatose-1,6-bisphosphate aldolase subunit GatZ/KbaZ
VDGLDHLQITRPEALATTYRIHEAAFANAGQSDAFSRVIGLVVQPGVEFGHDDVIHYMPEKARDLSAALADLPGIVFEAHSTDYQAEDSLRHLVADGFAILKVGPWLTFALREALYGLDAIADILDGHAPQNRLMQAMEAVMQSSPANWANTITATLPASGYSAISAIPTVSAVTGPILQQRRPWTPFGPVLPGA